MRGKVLFLVCGLGFSLLAKALPPSIKDEGAYKKFLEKRYGFSPEKVRFTERFAMVLRGSDGVAPKDPISCSSNTPLFKTVHTVVIGGGPAGLTASVYLTDRARRVLLLEKEDQLGGLAVGSSGELSYGRGGAYVTDTEQNLLRIYRHLGLGRYMENQVIPEPIDSYWWNGIYYRGLWNSESLSRLPVSFSVFKYLLEKADEEGLIPSQPFEEHEAISQMDQMSFADWVRGLPEELEKRALEGDKKAQVLLEKFVSSSEMNCSDPMRPVLKLLELYGRSALGEHPEAISAAAFANFYISEITERYSSSLGSGFVSEAALKKLRRRPWFQAEMNSPVRKIISLENGVRVCFQKGQSVFRVEAKHAVYAAPLKYAPELIENMKDLDSSKASVIEGIQYRNYQVMNVHLKGHPWHDTYDLWVRNDDSYTVDGVTDIIEGRWFEFEGNKKPRKDDKGILTLYNPLPEVTGGAALTEKEAIERGERAAIELENTLNEILEKRKKPPIEILAVEINRWPSSIHIAKPGHFIHQAKILARPIGEIYFANNNLGTPALEEALFRGYLAAKAILR